jgi:putative hydrolase of the HAD superfamily
MLERWTLGFDADDTLWHNERFFQMSQARFAEMLCDWVPAEELALRLLAAERRNLGRYGFGIKGFTLSMIETAIEVTDAKIPAQIIAELIEIGQEMLAHPIELLPGVEQTIASLAPEAQLILITKGDLLDQERKLAQSGLGDHFDAVEIVSDKTAETYQRIFASHGRARVAMVGNSLKSDILPALETGAWAVYVPHELTWELEHAEKPYKHSKFHEIPTLDHLPSLLRSIDGENT